ncbi:MAG: outer membrane protein transport protein [Candidatus Omnitrophica bacterium]|nr:outer membrane protein transport protein [Candidatus Omnitrophota bacterium]
MKNITVIASCIILLSVSHLFAQAFKNPPEGAAALSQSGAFIAQSDDSSAITHNPAGLVQIEGQQFILGSAFLYPVTEVKTTTYKGHSEETIAYLPYMFFSTDTGKGSPLYLGIGITFPYGQSTEWSKTAVRNWGYTVPYYSAMQTMNISPVVAYRITPSLSAGAGINIYKQQIKYEISCPGPVSPLESTGKLDVDGTTTGWTAGFLYRQESTV